MMIRRAKLALGEGYDVVLINHNFLFFRINNNPNLVIPAKAGIQLSSSVSIVIKLDPRLRGDDALKNISVNYPNLLPPLLTPLLLATAITKSLPGIWGKPLKFI